MLFPSTFATIVISTFLHSFAAAQLDTFSLAYSDTEDCPRLRRPFHTLTGEERKLYVNGFIELRRNGKLDAISAAHAANTPSHKGASFFFLHAYLFSPCPPSNF